MSARSGRSRARSHRQMSDSLYFYTKTMPYCGFQTSRRPASRWTVRSGRRLNIFSRPGSLRILRSETASAARQLRSRQDRLAKAVRSPCAATGTWFENRSCCADSGSNVEFQQQRNCFFQLEIDLWSRTHPSIISGRLVRTGAGVSTRASVGPNGHWLSRLPAALKSPRTRMRLVEELRNIRLKVVSSDAGSSFKISRLHQRVVPNRPQTDLGECLLPGRSQHGHQDCTMAVEPLEDSFSGVNRNTLRATQPS